MFTSQWLLALGTALLFQCYQEQRSAQMFYSPMLSSTFAKRETITTTATITIEITSNIFFTELD